MPKEGGHLPYYTVMDTKPLEERINLAIVRIKEEEDFYDYVLFRFIEILNDLKLIEEDLYKKLKYGTTDPRIISLIKNGFSLTVAELIMKEYSEFVTFPDSDNVLIDTSLHQRMTTDKIGFLQRYEVAQNVRSDN